MVDDLVPLPATGRQFQRRREVRLGDAAADGRLRLDAVARYLQDIANDDAREAIGADAAAWVVRRSTIVVHEWPRFQEPLTLTTFCGGTGGRWAERRTSISGSAGGHIEASSLWVHIDMASGRPVPLPPTFLDVFGAACGGRKVSGRLSHPAPPESTAGGREWSFRATDYDVMGHVNNAAYWAVVEEVLPMIAPGRYELEYRQPVEPHHPIDLVTGDDMVWMVSGGELHASARVIRGMAAATVVPR